MVDMFLQLLAAPYAGFFICVLVILAVSLTFRLRITITELTQLVPNRCQTQMAISSSEKRASCIARFSRLPREFIFELVLHIIAVLMLR